MRLVAHEPFESMEAAISRESDIFSDSTSVEIAPVRIRVADTDSGTDLKDRIIQLERLLRAYRDGTIVENNFSQKTLCKYFYLHRVFQSAGKSGYFLVVFWQ